MEYGPNEEAGAARAGGWTSGDGLEAVATPEADGATLRWGAARPESPGWPPQAADSSSRARRRPPRTPSRPTQRSIALMEGWGRVEIGPLRLASRRKFKAEAPERPALESLR